ncbi:MAG: hypothetical protein KBC95_02465 [Candidatus Peribacteraceae bacterium]|nr:hypothetical protein [Candidatus Peribacteraceae bacterium]
MGKPLAEPDDFADYLRESVTGLGLTLVDVQRDHGIALFKNVLGRERMTRDKLERLLTALPFQPDKKLEILSRYAGQARESLREVVVAGVRVHTQEGLAERADIGTSAISYILHGDPRRREGSVAREVTWATWLAIAKVMDLPEFRTIALWRKHMKAVLEAEDGATPFGTEVELLLARHPELSMNKLRTERPAPFDQMTVRAFQGFIRDLRAGEPQPWPQMRSLLDVYGAVPTEETGFALEWAKAVRPLSTKKQSTMQLKEGEAAYLAARLALIKQVAAERNGGKLPVRRAPVARTEPEADFSGDEPEEEDEDAARAFAEADDESDEAWDDYARLANRDDY